MTIRELLERSPLPEGTEGLLEPGALPPGEAERVLALALAGAGLPPVEKKEEGTMKKRNMALLLMAGVLCAGAVVASAAAWFQMDKGLARELGAKGDQVQGVGGTSIQTSRESEGWTLTVNQAVGDRNCAYLLLDLTAPEGTVLDADYYRLDMCLLEFQKKHSGSWSWSTPLEDPDKTDNKISFLVDMKMDGDLRGAKGTLKASGLKVVWFDPEEKGNDREECLSQLEWELPFQLDYQDEMTTYRPQKTLHVERGLIKGDVTVEKVEVGPLSMLIRLSGDEHILRRVDFATGGTPAIGAVLLEIKDQAGEAIPVWATSSGEKDCVATFLPLIDPQQVSALVLDGVEIPLK